MSADDTLTNSNRSFKNVSLPTRICVEYANAATQTASGYFTCDTVNIPSGCGSDVSAIDFRNPSRIRPLATIVLSDAGKSLVIAEGGSGTFDVSLSAAPRADATVSLTNTNTNSDITFSPTSLTFTTDNYSTPQEVSVSAGEDADSAHDSDTITLSASGGIDAPSLTKSVSVTDNDKPSGTIVLSPSNPLPVNEGGSATLSVSLSVAPNANVTVSLTKTNTNSDITFSPTSLTFTANNYSTPQEVSVSAGEDADSAHDSDTITLSASGGIDAPSLTKSVSVTDNDKPSGTIVLSPSSPLSVNEGGSATLSVRLSVAPNAAVTVSLTKTNTNSDITFSPTSLTFTTDNYSTPQEVSVSAGEDADSAHDSDTITLSASGGIDAPSLTKSVSVTDNDKPSGTIVLSPSSPLSVNEGGSAALSVSLSTAPNADVTLSLANTNSDITLDKTSLTFTTSNWNRTQTVIVNAAQDADTTNDSDIITLTASGGITAPSLTKAVSVVDDDDDSSTTPSGAIQVPSSNTLNIDEGGSGFFDVSLSTAPNADVRVLLSKTNDDITLSPTSLTFTVSNFERAQRVTVFAAEDVDTADDSDTITLSASGGLDAGDKTISVLVEDDDDPSTPSGAIVLSSQTLTIGEGRSESVDISLDTAPNADVRISLSKTNADITLSPSSLTFTASNHSTAQQLTISAAEDADTANDTDTITLSASGGIRTPQMTKSVFVRDNDSPTPPPTTPPPTAPPPTAPPPTNPYDGTLVFLPAGNLTIDEEGRQTVSVKLSKRPRGVVSVLISKTSSALGIGISREVMRFTPTNWDRYQSIDIIAHKDSDKSDDSHFVSFEFAGKRILRRRVIVIDNDKESLRSQALALPPPTSSDGATLRIQCRQDSPCAVALDCSAQADGEVFLGRLPQPIPAWGTAFLSVQDIQAYTGGKSWAGKGRLGCALRSSATIGSQVWTLSGAGAMANNSAVIRSVAEGGVHRADIESIPSPDSSDESNIRIRCNSQEGDCFETSFVCYTDDGSKYEWNLGRIERLSTRHLQSEELARGIGYRWEGLGLSCEVRSSRRFTAQALTRTGGGGALINNSATGEMR